LILVGKRVKVLFKFATEKNLGGIISKKSSLYYLEKRTKGWVMNYTKTGAM